MEACHAKRRAPGSTFSTAIETGFNSTHHYGIVDTSTVVTLQQILIHNNNSDPLNPFPRSSASMTLGHQDLQPQRSLQVTFSTRSYQGWWRV